MQVYVSKDGQQYGPYTVGQLRQYVETGNFVPTDHACCDGANWVTIADVPGFAPATEKPVQKQVEKSGKKPRGKLYLIIGLAALLIVASSVGLYFALSGEETPAKEPQGDVKKASASPAAPDLFDLTPEALVSVYDGDTCTVDLDLGLSITLHKQKIRLNRINAPELRGRSQRRGRAVRDFLRGVIQEKEVLLQTIKDRKGKYGRYLGEIWVKQGRRMVNVNDRLVTEGLLGDIFMGGVDDLG